jgi:2-hydroxy-3-keto-5-methylthiopentenyl-1-phosphate phosphatase
MTAAGPATRLVLDWDGTVTVRDTLGLVMERYGDSALWRQTGRRMGRSLTHDEAIALGFATVCAPLGEVVDWLLRVVALRAGFGVLVEHHHPLVLSSGFHELIEPVLEREGVSVDLVANHVDARPEGWRVRFREVPLCPVCGEPCKRGALPRTDVVYVGDGYSDRCAALAARRVFARADLAEHLSARGVRHEPFEDLHDVADALAGGGTECR